MVRIGDNWYTLDGITQYLFGETNPMNPTVGIDSSGKLVLIDTCEHGDIVKIEHSLARLGYHLEDIKWVFVTHSHHDHIGNVALLEERYDVESFAHFLDIPTIRGEKFPKEKLPNFGEIRRLFPDFNEFASASQAEDKGGKEFVVPPKIRNSLRGGEFFDIAGGFEIIHTPGHTPGHIAILLKKEKALVAGDLMMFWKGKFEGPVGTFSDDLEEAQRSVKKVSTMDFDRLVGYHGAPLTENAKEYINKYLSLNNL